MKNFFKKFFKILRKIIKILLKIILWLILGIIIIGGIILLIINNRTLKFYENDDGDMRFTMNKDFKIENGTDLKIKLKYLGAEVSEFENGYLYSDGFININLPDLSLLKQLYKQGDIENFLEILQYCFDADYTEYYDNGQTAKNGQFINGLENGYFVSYYENGQIEEELNFINREKDGYWTGYYDNGQIMYIGNYKNGEEIGKHITYYENGNILEEGNYINGQMDGSRTGYYDDGNIKYILNYNNGKLNGKSVLYNEDGSHADIESNDGVGIITIYNKNNNIKLKYGFLSDEFNNIIYNGKYIRYFEDGKFTEGNYINGQMDGSRTGYYDDNSIRFLGNFENGLGIISHFDENGNLIGTGEQFGNGHQTYTKNGLDISLYENGQIASMCNYLDGVKNGSCTTYYENGQIMEIGEYKNYYKNNNEYFNKIGKYNYYDENGNFIGSGEISCLKENDNICEIPSRNGFIFDYYPSYKIKEMYYRNGIDNYKTGYYENGNVKYTDIYDNGKRIKTEYYENGKIKNKLNFNGMSTKNGERIEYFEDGSISEKGNYIDGKENGYRVSYFEDGQIYSEGNYDDGKKVGTRNRYLGDGSICVSKNYDE